MALGKGPGNLAASIFRDLKLAGRLLPSPETIAIMAQWSDVPVRIRNPGVRVPDAALFCEKNPIWEIN